MDRAQLPAAIPFSPSADGDDLKRIQGIGPVIERQLKDAGVFTFAQLAALKAGQIAQLLANLPLLSAERIDRQDWPAQARALALESTQIEPAAVALARDGRTRSATFKVELQVDPQGLASWSRVAHVEGGTQAGWPGWNAEGLVRFISDHAVGGRTTAAQDDRRSDTPGTVDSGAHTQSGEPAADWSGPDRFGQCWIEITDLSIEEPAVAQAVNGSPLVARVRAALGFRLRGPGAAQLAARAPRCTLQLLSYDPDAGQSAVLAVAHQQLSPGQLDRRAFLEFSLPDDGRYQLIGLILIADAQLVASALGPVLRVIP